MGLIKLKSIDMRKSIYLILIVILAPDYSLPVRTSSSKVAFKADVIVYGGTSAAVTAAVQVHRMGRIGHYRIARQTPWGNVILRTRIYRYRE